MVKEREEGTAAKVFEVICQCQVNRVVVRRRLIFPTSASSIHLHQTLRVVSKDEERKRKTASGSCYNYNCFSPLFLASLVRLLRCEL